MSIYVESKDDAVGRGGVSGWGSTYIITIIVYTNASNHVVPVMS